MRTEHNDEAVPDREEARQYVRLLRRIFESYRPEMVIGANGHPMIQLGLELAKREQVTTAFAVRGYGYDDSKFFTYVDHVFTCSKYLSEHLLATAGQPSTPLDPPIAWSEVLVPAESRSFVTFINPSPHKGVALFARLADMLGRDRPDIPVVVIQSGQSAFSLNTIPGVDFTKYPQIMAGPHTDNPNEIYALTKVLLVPSVWSEPFGRVAAEALINGIPPIVSDRGALPDVIEGDYDQGGAGLVCSLPESLTSETARLPEEEDVQPWFDAVCKLWDDTSFYAELSRRGQALATRRYGEEVTRKRHVDFFVGLLQSNAAKVTGPALTALTDLDD